MSITSLLVRGLKKGLWEWNDATNSLQFVSSVLERKQRKQIEKKSLTAVNGLTYVAMKVNLEFRATVSEVEMMEFRHVLKKRNSNRKDTIVTIQDCKIVAIFLCISPLPSLFHAFFNLVAMNQLLRACIVYIQFYLQEREAAWLRALLEVAKIVIINKSHLKQMLSSNFYTIMTCETLAKTQHYLKRNSGSEKTSTHQALKEDLDDLRVLIGRFYAGILLSDMEQSEMSKSDQIMLFECFLRVSTIVVWIALERKYLNLIKVELERIFRTRYFNNFERYESDNGQNFINKDNLVILDGKIAEVDRKKEKVVSRLNSNSPIIHNFIRMDEPKLVMIRMKDFENLRDDRLKFLTKYIFLPETEIQDEGVSLGILGLHRRLFDPLLYPCSKRVLKLLITGSPMDIAEDRNKLREFAMKKSQRESEPQSPHIFDDLPKIPRPNQYTEDTVEEVVEKEELEAQEETEEYEGESEEQEESEESLLDVED